jgi:hypothetical protein
MEDTTNIANEEQTSRLQQPAVRRRPSRILALPVCRHGRPLSDWGGNWNELPCGCNFDTASEEQRDVMAMLKLGLGVA